MIRYNQYKINLKLKIAPGGSLCLISQTPSGHFFKEALMQIGKLICIFLLLFVVGCKGPKGDAGDPGTKGEKGDPGVAGEDTTATTYQGLITSDDVFVSISGVNVSNPPAINVYVGDISNNWTQSPIVVESIEIVDFNFIEKYVVRIVGAETSGFTKFYIIVTSYPQSPRLSAKERFDFFRF